MELEEKHKEKWSWDKQTLSKAQGLFAACPKFDRLVAFAVLYNGLEPLKLLVTKLQKRNQDIYQAYQMISQVINDLRETKDNMDKEFRHWYEIIWQIENIQNCLLCYPLFVFHQNLILMPLLHHFKKLLVMICQQTQQAFFEVK